MAGSNGPKDRCALVVCRVCGLFERHSCEYWIGDMNHYCCYEIAVGGAEDLLLLRQRGSAQSLRQQQQQQQQKLVAADAGDVTG